MNNSLIKHNHVVNDDPWQLFPFEDPCEPEHIKLSGQNIIFPLVVWHARKQEIATDHTPFGLVLEPTDELEDIADDLQQFGQSLALIAVSFPRFSDGRGYSIARLLRDRYAYQGELRAIGDVLVDQLFYMNRVGFDSFLLREDQNPQSALKAFSTFSNAYQNATDYDLPLFRRRDQA